MITNDLLIVVFSDETLRKFWYRFNLPHYQLINVLILAVPTLLLIIFTRKILFSFFFVCFLLVTLGLIHSIKFNLNDEPLYGWDYGLWDESLAVVNLYSNNLEVLTLYVVPPILIMVFVLFAFKEKKLVIDRKIQTLNLIIISIICIISVIFSPFKVSDIKVKHSKHSRKIAYKRYGFVYSLLVGLSYERETNPLITSNYSRDRMFALDDKYGGAVKPPWVDSNSEKPNVIFYMIESLQDLSNNGVSFSTDPLSSLHKVKYNKNNHSGVAISSTFGGMSSKSEFEALTGLPMQSSINYNSQTPYIGFQRRPILSIPNILKKFGYKTKIIVAAKKDNFNRHRIFKYLGFDEYFSVTDEMKNPKDFYGRVSDENIYEKSRDYILKNLDKPFFLNIFTDSTHSGYERVKGNNHFNPLSNLLTVEEKDLVKKYATAVNHADFYLQKFLDFLSGLNRPTIVFIYGDHRPALGEVYKSLKIENVDLYQVPFVVWSNSIKITEIPEKIGIHFIGYFALKALGFKKFPGQFAFLHEMSNSITSLSRYILTLEGFTYGNEEPKYQQISLDYALYKYDILRGNNYISKKYLGD